jgi:hypothetical protein
MEKLQDLKIQIQMSICIVENALSDVDQALFMIEMLEDTMYLGN